MTWPISGHEALDEESSVERVISVDLLDALEVALVAANHLRENEVVALGNEHAETP